MPGTYSQILLHVVYSTKLREPWITPDLAERLYPYIGGIIRAERGVLYDIGGVADHVHLCLRWRPDESISNLMRTVKARSSGWVHDTFPTLNTFAWQEGYSVSPSASRRSRPSRSTSPVRRNITSGRISRPNCYDCFGRMRLSSTSVTPSIERMRSEGWSALRPLPRRGGGM